MAGTALAQTFTQDLDRAWSLYNNGKYQEAHEALTKFVQTYQNDALFPEVNNRVRYLIALTLVRLNNWDAIAPAVDEYEKVKGKSPDAWTNELMFWKGVGLLKSGRAEEARGVFEQYLKTYPQSDKDRTVRLLLALSMIEAGQWAEAAKFLETMRRTSRGAEWGRVLLLETFCLIQADELEKALVLVDEGHENWRRLGQITAFELLAVQLAEKLLDQPDKSEAIRSLIRIKPQAEILKLQDEQIKSLESYAADLKKRDPNGIETLLTEGLLKQVKKEREDFAGLQNFDSSVRFRIAKAFLDEERYRETAFVLETMLDNLPADDVVEKATETLAACYTQIGRWDKVVEVADTFAEKFPNSELMPRILIQKGLALQEENKLAEAQQVFDEFLKRYPRDELAGEAAFLRAFNAVLEENFDEAAKRFAETADKHKSVEEKATFWEAQALSMGEKHEAAVPKYEAFLKKFPNSTFADEVTYRHAFSLHALGDYEKSIPELQAYMQKNPVSPNSGEAALLLGDAYFAQDQYDKAIEILMGIPKGVSTYREEAYFKVAKYYQLAEEREKLREHLAKFQQEYPESARLAEAVHKIGLSYQDDPERQREVFWEAIDRFGDDPKQWGVTDMIGSLAKLSRDPETREKTLQRLNALAEKARQDGKRSLELNAKWGVASLQERETADQTLAGLLPLLKADVDNPQILIDVALALQRQGRTDDAISVYKEIRRWNPQSPLNQIVFANLGLIAAEKGDTEEASRYFRRYFEETPAIMNRGPILVKSAEMERAKGNIDRALELYNEGLGDRGVPREQKAQALLAIGDIHLSRNKPELAVPYYQRVYILYGAYPDFVAEAYLRSGDAFMKLKDQLSAARTYREMLDSPALQDSKYDAQRNEAKKRLEALPADVRAKAEQAAKEAAAATSTEGA